MSDFSYLKKLSILYVEDDFHARKAIGSTMKKLCKDIYIANDGHDALELYTKLKKSNTQLDAIVSDVNMPELNGLDLLTIIREDDMDLPFVFTTAYSNSEYLLKSINLDVSEYVLKPINIPNLLEKIIKVCSKKNRDDLIKKERNELENYLNVIDKVAIISKTDLKGNITFVNDNFCKITLYEKNELVGFHYGLLRHPDVPAGSFKSMWKTIKSGKTWQGKAKNRAKNGSSYYVNETIIPIYDTSNKNIDKFIGIRFLITNEELEKREFKKKVLKNIQDTKKKQFEYAQNIKTLQNKLKRSDHIDLVEDALDIERKKSTKLNNQVTYYEDAIKSIVEKNKTLTQNANDKVEKATSFAFKERTQNIKLSNETEELKETLDEQEEALRKMKYRIIEQDKAIRELREVIEHQDKKLGIH